MVGHPPAAMMMVPGMTVVVVVAVAVEVNVGSVIVVPVHLSVSLAAERSVSRDPIPIARRVRRVVVAAGRPVMRLGAMRWTEGRDESAEGQLVHKGPRTVCACSNCHPWCVRVCKMDRWR